MITILGHNIQGVAFDLEGTIINLEPMHFAAHLKIAQQLGLKIDLDDPKTFEKLPHFIGGPGIEVMRDIIRLAQESGMKPKSIPSAEELKQLDDRHFQLLIEALPDEEFRPREGFLDLFMQFKNKDILMAIGTLDTKEEASLLLRKSGLDKLFNDNQIITKEDVVNIKPNPEVYQRTAECLGIDPGKQLVFDDSVNGIRAAIEAGSIAIAMPTNTEESFKKRFMDVGALAVYENWRHVPVEQNTSRPEIR